VQSASSLNPDCECLAVLLLNTRRRVKGHHIVSIGTMDTILEMLPVRPKSFVVDKQKRDLATVLGMVIS
jgi:hypothetical protein